MRELYPRDAASPSWQGCLVHPAGRVIRLVVETGREPEDLKMMIGLRTLDEGKARDLFTAAFVAAVEKLSGLQKKLAA